ncbi:MAG: hypothetical protein BWY83_00844 [bacterium ADurb.Bin478]|nr:MAG: hypothetical protein BWY83_00844 [bacterium ADurb.Bin478]
MQLGGEQHAHIQRHGRGAHVPQFLLHILAGKADGKAIGEAAAVAAAERQVGRAEILPCALGIKNRPHLHFIHAQGSDAESDGVGRGQRNGYARVVKRDIGDPLRMAHGHHGFTQPREPGWIPVQRRGVVRCRHKRSTHGQSPAADLDGQERRCAGADFGHGLRSQIASGHQADQDKKE